MQLGVGGAVRAGPEQAAARLRLPQDVEGLVEKVYDDGDLPCPEHWQPSLNRARLELDIARREAESKACKATIPLPDFEDDLIAEITPRLEEDNPELHQTYQAFTRLTEESVNLIFLYLVDGRTCLDPEGRHPVDLAHRPTLEQTKALLMNGAPLTRKSCVAHYRNQTCPPGWQEAPLLRYHRVVRLSPDGTSLPGEFSMHVSARSGIHLYINSD